MNISEISVNSAQFQADSWKSLLHINLHWLPIQNTMTLYNFALKQSSALIFAQGMNLSEYYVRCKYGCNRLLHFGAVGVQRTSHRVQCKIVASFSPSPRALSLCKTYTCVDMNKWNIMQAISALAFIPFGSYRRTNLCLQKFWRPTVLKLCNYLTWDYACM